MSNSVKREDFISDQKWDMVQNMMVVGVCSVCGQVVTATKNDLAPRHGFKRYRRQMNQAPNSFKRFSQEDNKACAGSGKEVVWKKVK